MRARTDSHGRAATQSVCARSWKPGASARGGGWLFVDKPGTARLAVVRTAFTPPPPAGGTLGGVAARTREAMLLCEAAGIDVILVETVGVGQSETTGADLTDVFVVLML